jgi:KDO2-lipid IV(A) lauroyltransferase
MRVLFWLIQHLPRFIVLGLLSFVTWAIWVLGVRRKVALENLAIAFPEKSPEERRALARNAYRHLAVTLTDFLRTPVLSDAQLAAMIDPQGWEKIEPLYTHKKGFIVTCCHFGNFEILGVYGARRGVPLTALTRNLKGAANALYVQVRGMAGTKEIHKGMDNLVASVQAGETLAIFIDQNMLPKRAIFVPFFGKLAATTPAPAVVAERTGAPVFMCQIVRLPDGKYRTLIEGPFHFERKSEDRDEDVRAFTAMLNDVFEKMVRAYPEQWLWLHRRWKTRPPQETAAAPAPEPAKAAVH